MSIYVYTAQLVPIRFWRMGYGRVVRTLATAVCSVGVSKIWGPRFATGIHLMKQFAHSWYLPWCKCTVSCYHVSFIQNNIYMPAPGVSSSVENRSCPESTRCCGQCVIPLSWCQSVFDGWVMAEWLGRWLQQWVAWGASEILGFPVRYWHPPHEAIRS